MAAHVVPLDIKDDNIGVVVDQNPPPSSSTTAPVSISPSSLLFIQKLIAEGLATYFLMFGGCAAVLVNLEHDQIVTFPGIATVWGLIVMAMIYSVGHISGAHFNPAVTIAFATCRRFPWKQVPGYILVQVVGSILACGTLQLMFRWDQRHFLGSVPAGSELQSLAMEFIATFYLMFVISGVATDNRAIGELAGLAIGATVTLNVLFAGPVSGASMNPARSLGPAMVSNNYKGIWIYIVGPTLGAISGAWIYNTVRFTTKSLSDITKTGSFLKRSSSDCSV